MSLNWIGLRCTAQLIDELKTSDPEAVHQVLLSFDLQDVDWPRLLVKIARDMPLALKTVMHFAPLSRAATPAKPENQINYSAIMHALAFSLSGRPELAVCLVDFIRGQQNVLKAYQLIEAANIAAWMGEDTLRMTLEVIDNKDEILWFQIAQEIAVMGSAKLEIVSKAFHA